MVHALKQTHKILRSNGILISIHNLSVPHLVEVRSPQAATKIGWMTDSTGFKSELSGFNALAQVVADGYFVPEDEQDFIFNIYIDDVREMQEWLAEWWEDAILPEGTIQRIKEVLGEAGSLAKIVILLSTRMTKLRVA